MFGLAQQFGLAEMGPDQRNVTNRGLGLMAFGQGLQQMSLGQPLNMMGSPAAQMLRHRRHTDALQQSGLFNGMTPHAQSLLRNMSHYGMSPFPYIPQGMGLAGMFMRPQQPDPHFSAIPVGFKMQTGSRGRR